MKMWRNKQEKISLRSYKECLDAFKDKKGVIRWNALLTCAANWEKAKTEKSKADLQERTLLNGFNNFLQTLIHEGAFDAVKVEHVNDGLLTAFKKLGKDTPCLMFLDGKYSKGKQRQFTSQAIEIPLKLFSSSEVTLAGTPLTIKVKNVLRKMNILDEKRGGVTGQRNNKIAAFVEDVCIIWLDKHNRLPSANEVYDYLARIHKNPPDTSTLENYIKRAIIPSICYKVRSLNKKRRPK